MHKTKIKRISLSLLAIILTGAISIGVSRALFFDEEIVETNFSLGTLNLRVGDTDPATAVLDFTNMEPGDERDYSLDLVNTGTVDGNFWLEGIVTDSVSGNDGTQPGNIENCARMSIEVVDTTSSTVTIVNNELLVDLDQGFDKDYETSVDIGVNNGPIPMKVEVNTHDCGNEAMGDMLEMELRFHLEQVI